MESHQSSQDQRKNVPDSHSGHFLIKNKKDTSLPYFSEKAKKMVTAIYLVTNLIPDGDPLRHSIRDMSVRLLSVLGMFNSQLAIENQDKEIQGLSEKIVDLLEVAFFAGYVSEMNFSVIKSEFDAFANEISNHGSLQPAIIAESLRVAGPSNEKPYSNPKNVEKPGLKRVLSAPAETVNKTNSEAKKVSRKEAILSIIRRRGKVSIKDISSVIIDCSEKTIQRELIALVSANVLKRSGDRRWSIYSLVE